MTKYSFSGHDSFYCKQLWLKKGYDFIKKGKKFQDPESVIELGVGKNMVSSIRHWMKVFGLIDESDIATDFAKYIFEDNGKDPYLEDLGTLWLLHYFLIKTNRATLYNLFFTEFRFLRYEFTKEQLLEYIVKKFEKDSVNKNTVETDILILFRNYFASKNRNEIEETNSSLFQELNLLSSFKEFDNQNNKTLEYYKIENLDKINIPKHIMLFCILDQFKDRNSISINELFNSVNSIGSIFPVSREFINNTISEFKENYPSINYSTMAGNKLLIFKKPIDKWKVLNDYYKI